MGFQLHSKALNNIQMKSPCLHRMNNVAGMTAGSNCVILNKKILTLCFLVCFMYF